MRAPEDPPGAARPAREPWISPADLPTALLPLLVSTRLSLNLYQMQRGHPRHPYFLFPYPRFFFRYRGGWLSDVHHLALTWPEYERSWVRWSLALQGAPGGSAAGRGGPQARSARPRRPNAPQRPPAPLPGVLCTWPRCADRRPPCGQADGPARRQESPLRPAGPRHAASGFRAGCVSAGPDPRIAGRALSRGRAYRRWRRRTAGTSPFVSNGVSLGLDRRFGTKST